MSDGLKVLLGVLGGAAIVVLLLLGALSGGGMGGMGYMMSGGMMGGGIVSMLFMLTILGAGHSADRSAGSLDRWSVTASVDLHAPMKTGRAGRRSPALLLALSTS